MRKQITEFLATGFYTGKIPFMPGTFGTMLAVPLVWFLAQAGAYTYALVTLGSILFATAVAELYEQTTTAHDPGEVVIDEVVGYLISMLWLPLTWQSFLFSFLLFRVLDIFKPFPISYIDRKIPGGLGTILDDAAAGLVTDLVLQVVYVNTIWLGARYYGA